jgi:DNA repair exonuclease SbcCD ATPase subunit
MTVHSEHLQSNGRDVAHDDTRHSDGSNGAQQAVSDNGGPVSKLAECDRHLASIGTEVESLQHELARLREMARERDGLLEERDVAIAELSALLPTLDAERVRSRREAHAATLELRRTKAELSEQAATAAALRGELDELRARSTDRERTITELHASLTQVSATLEDSQRALADAELRARAAEPARRELEVVSAERDRLLVMIDDERERARQQIEEAAEMSRNAEERAQREATRAAALERELMSFGVALAQRVGRLAELEAGLSATESRAVASQDTASLAGDVFERSRTGHLRFILVPTGYKLVDDDSPPPSEGDHLEVEGRRFVAAKIGRSPISGDERPCVYLLEEPDLDEDVAHVFSEAVEAASTPLRARSGDARSSDNPSDIKPSFF